MSRGLFGFGFLQVSLDRLVCCLAQLNAGYTRKRKKRKELQTGLYNSPVRTAREKVLSASWNSLFLCQILSLKLNYANPKRVQLSYATYKPKLQTPNQKSNKLKLQHTVSAQHESKKLTWEKLKWLPTERSLVVLLAFALQWSGVENARPGWP